MIDTIKRFGIRFDQHLNEIMYTDWLPKTPKLTHIAL